jgi:hypothetical protein
MKSPSSCCLATQSRSFSSASKTLRNLSLAFTFGAAALKPAQSEGAVTFAENIQLALTVGEQMASNDQVRKFQIVPDAGVTTPLMSVSAAP